MFFRMVTVIGRLIKLKRFKYNIWGCNYGGKEEDIS